MSDLISRDKLKDNIAQALSYSPPETSYMSMTVKRILNAIDEEEAVDAAPVVHGNWIPIYPSTASRARGYTDMYKCSSCENVVYLGTMTTECDYDGCPYCFAKMDEVSE